VPEVSTREAPSAAPVTGPRRFTLGQRIILRIIIWTGCWFIRLIGPTLRIAVSREEGAPASPGTRPSVASSWHSGIIPAT